MGAPILLSIRRKSAGAAVTSADDAFTSRSNSSKITVDANHHHNSNNNTFFPKRLANIRTHCRSLSSSPRTITTTATAKQGNENIKPKRSMRLSISPDEEESDSMQVTMLSPMKNTTPHNNNAKYSVIQGGVNLNEEQFKDDTCIYTVGSVEYSVHHHSESTSSNYCSSSSSTATTITTSDSTSSVSTAPLLQHIDTDVRTSNGAEVESEALQASSSGEGGNKKSVSRMGSFFKKGSSKTPEGNNDSGGSGGSNDMNNHSGDGDKKDNNNNNRNNDHRPDKNNISSTSPRDAAFGPERIQFAHESTLPLHSGPESAAPTHHPSWTPVPGTQFKVRAGPNYPKNGKKENSCESLYEVYCVRYFRSAKATVGGASRIMPLPELVSDDLADNAALEENLGTNAKTGGGTPPPSPPHHPELFGTKVPDVLVVHFMLPYETPNMFKTKEDGAGGECIYYLKPSQRFLDEISGRLPPTPATKLFVRWCNECEFNAKMRGRFKCMALVRDIDRHNLSLLKSYNGKPVLITESGRMCSGVQGGVRYLEMIANVHYWAYMAKKGFVSLIPKFANMQMEVGFTIEAHTDSEMPECMLGSTVLSYITDTTGPMIPPSLQEPVHEHQA